MKRTPAFQFNFINSLAIVLFLLILPLTESFATAGCCSHHGGVTGCAATGFQMCKDNTASPSCKCNGTTVPKTTTKSTKSTTTTNTKTPKPAVKKSTTTTAPVAKTKITGCCSRHGGIAQCNKATGFQTCKDGTASATCKCN
jgi:hypothetical protein